jgi:hypothetical protein
MEAVPANGSNSTMIGLKDSSSVRVGQRWPMPLPGNRYVRSRPAALRPTFRDSPFSTFAQGHRHSRRSSGGTARVSRRTAGIHSVGRSGHGDTVRSQSVRPAGERFRSRTGRHRPNGRTKAALSASGTLFYLKGRAEYLPVLVKNGSVPTPLRRELHVYSTPRFSPDGGRVAISVMGPRSSDIWIYDIQRNTFTRLTSDGGNVRPEWTADGKRVLFRSERAGKVGIWWQPADGSGPAEILYDPPVEAFEAIISPDSKWLVFRTAPAVCTRATFSPCRSMVASEDSSARDRSSERTDAAHLSGWEVARLSVQRWRKIRDLVRPFPGTGARTQVSSDGGTEPIWNRGGTSLFYRDAIGQFTEVKVTTGANFSIGQRKVVVTGEYLTDASHANYDVAPDGSLLLLKRAGAESQTIIVHNWIRELREKTRSSAARR